MKNDYSIQIRIHAIDAPDADAAIERAREILVANVPDAHEYAIDEIECDDDYDDDHDLDDDFRPRFIVTFSRDF